MSAASPPSDGPPAPLDPPTHFRGMLRFLGPGFVLSASIVGAGELIATTVLGAEAGFITLWVILVSCFVKVAVQLEFGKHAIATGETTMEAFNRLPGPRLGKANWSIWGWLALMVIKLLQMGGIVGTVAIILHLAFSGAGAAPDTGGLPPETGWVLGVAAVVALLVFRGYYRFIETTTLAMTGLFTVFTILSLVNLQFTDLAISWPDVASGLTFQLPPELVLVAAGAFGLTGVGGDEIMAYTYWLIEKGYAAHAGKPDGSEAWARRARGWIRIMYVDAFLSMVVYTVVTAAFYLLGAAVLHTGEGGIPESSAELVGRLASIYTETLGPWARTVFLAGSVVVLFSTLFAALAAWTRMFSDAFSRIGFFDYSDLRARRRAIAFFGWFFPAIWSLCYLFYSAPAQMVLLGGIATSFILVVVAFAALHFRYKRLDPRLTPGRGYDIFLWLSVAAIMAVGAYGVVQVLGKTGGG